MILRTLLDRYIFIELLSPGVDSAETGKIAISETLNVSRGGLRVTLEHELIAGAILQIGVDLPDNPNTLHLAAEVKWCVANTAPHTGWSAGFALLKAGHSDIDRWIALLTSLES